MDESRYRQLAAQLSERGTDVPEVERLLSAQRIETPSWGYGRSGTRFGAFPQPGEPRTTLEKLEDAAAVQRATGVCPSVAIHIPWDIVDDWDELAGQVRDLGLQIGAVNPNLFQEQEYKLGSLCHPAAAVRRKAVDHMLECVAIAETVGSDAISLWLADGTSYPGQDDIADRRRRLIDCLGEVVAAMPPSQRLLVEYKLYEPAFYHTDLADWGGALLVCQALGEQTKVLVDLGHHAQSVNIEHIVSTLLGEGRLGGFHFNNRKYGDDDLIVGSVNPFELYLIYHELVNGAADRAGVGYVIDQSHNVEAKIEAMILSVTNLQAAYAKALLVDRAALAAAQVAGDVVEAHRLIVDAYSIDVRPLCAKVREGLGAAADPLTAHRASGYDAKAAERRR
ncbi:MAG TPA: L-rhamnose isomerase [Gaiellales bacterium]